MANEDYFLYATEKMVHSILQNNQKRHANPEKTLCTNKELHELCVALKMATKCLQFQAENAYRTPKRRFFFLHGIASIFVTNYFLHFQQITRVHIPQNIYISF